MSRVLLKLSGESFANPDTNFGIEPKVIDRIASEISAANNENIQIGVVVGGGNFFRGVQESAKNMAQANADYMGMLATVINAVALKDALDKNGTQTRVQSAITKKVELLFLQQVQVTHILQLIQRLHFEQQK